MSKKPKDDGDANRDQKEALEFGRNYEKRQEFRDASKKPRDSEYSSKKGGGTGIFDPEIFSKDQSSQGEYEQPRKKVASRKSPSLPRRKRKTSKNRKAA